MPEDTVATPSQDWEDMRERWLLIDRLLAGTDAVRAESYAASGRSTLRAAAGSPNLALSTTALPGQKAMKEAATAPTSAGVLVPRREKESKADYEHRLFHLTCVPTFLDDAIDDAVGSVLGGGGEGVKPEGEGAVGGKLGEWITGEVDRAGNSLAVMLAMGLEPAVGYGLSFFWVNHTDRQPFWHVRRLAQVIDTDYGDDGSGRWRLLGARVAIDSKGKRQIWTYHAGDPNAPAGAVVRPDEVSGARGSGLDRYPRYEVHELQQEGDEDPEWVDVTSSVSAVPYIVPPRGLGEEAEAQFTEIPLYPIYGGRYVRPWVAYPVLGKVAELSKMYMLKTSVRNAIEEYANIPRDVYNGTWEELVNANSGAPAIGTGGIICTDGRELESYEHSGSAIGSMRLSIEDLKIEIREAAFQAVMARPTGTELATAHYREERRKATRLHLVRAFARNAFESALQRTAAFYNETEIGEWRWPEIDMSRMTSPKEMAELLERLGSAEVVSGQTVLEALQALGRLPSSIEPEDEPARLREQMGATSGL